MSNIANDDRITFHQKQQIMEVDFSNVLFDTATQVNEFYDLVEEKITATGQQKWYFLVNYKNCRLSPQAWIPFSNRGKKVNIASSLGSVRFAVSDETGKTILRQSARENFDPNLFSSRQAALAHLAEMRDKANIAADKGSPPPKADALKPHIPVRSIDSRVTFLSDLEIMDVDFSDYVFSDIASVNEFYDAIAAKIGQTDRNWYFMVNYRGTEIFPDAWYQWAIRSRRLNSAHSLGTVRFNPDDAARKDIMKRAHANESDPNLMTSRKDAIARIIQMRRDRQV